MVEHEAGLIPPLFALKHSDLGEPADVSKLWSMSHTYFRLDWGRVNTLPMGGGLRRLLMASLLRCGNIQLHCLCHIGDADVCPVVVGQDLGFH